MEQRTDEWFAARLGKVTASRVADVIATTKTGYSASRANYMAQLVVERMTGKQTESFTNAAMEWGTNTEPLARAAYEAEKGLLVDETGLVDHPSIPMSGASPDGLVGEDGGIEIKSPEPWTHMQTIIEGKMPAKHVAQTQGFLFVTGRQWVDFVSYCPLYPAQHQIFIERQYRDEKYIAALDAATANAQELLIKHTGDQK